ncbi:MAG: hypothetical protein C4308_10405 [Chitinophagaceae bacterium]
MKKLAFLIFFVCIYTVQSYAQRVYFIYLQTEAAQPFFVRMNDKVYSSTASGYLIIPKLIDSTYVFRVGFPGKSMELDFSATVNRKDHGYLIKDFGERGWGLFDLQSLNVQMATNTQPKTQASSDTKVNAFTDLLSKSSDDPSLKEKPVVVQQEKKPEIVAVVNKQETKVNKEETRPVEIEKQKEENKTDSLIVKAKEGKKSEPELIEKKIDSAVAIKETVEPYIKSQIAILSTTSIADGRQIVYVDQRAGERPDTIIAILPEIKTEEPKPKIEKQEKKFLDITNDPVSEEKEIKKQEARQETKSHPLVQRNCKSVASDEDFLKLRRKMAAKTNDDGMLDEAKKYFKTRCFKTEQIRNLSTMFLSNAGKYHFFDLAYAYVSDGENFSSLQSELKDEYYSNRFRAMLGDYRQ